MNTALWLILLIVFMYAEAATVTMVSAWFAIGALAALAASLLGAKVWLQIVVFLAVSAAMLALLRPIAKKYFNPQITRTNVDALAGKTCLVTASIDNLQGTGKIKLGDVEWTARSEDGSPIAEGTRVQIRRVEGVKVYVTPLAVEVK